jgi:hypothetical protein
MLTFFSLLIVFAVAATAVTVYAYLTAKEGFEDQLGFHALSTPASPEMDTADNDESVKSSSRDIPPFAAAR